MFKKFFTIAAAAIVVAGCSKETVSVKDGTTQLKPISFTSYTQGEVKAGDVTGDNLGDIHVAARYTGTEESATEVKYFNATVTKASSYTTSYYWPAAGTLKFYASNIAIGDAGVVAVSSIDDDVVVAKNSATCAGSSSSKVDLTFSHIFSKITVKAKVADESLKAAITEIKVVAKAPVSYDVAATTNNWTLGESASGVTYMNTATNITSTTAAEVALSKSYVAPQTGVSISITYKLTTTGDVVVADYSSTPKSITGLEFVAGKNNILNLTFDGEKIAFTPTVTAWTDNSSEEQTIK